MRWHSIWRKQLAGTVATFQAKLHLRLVDYSGSQIAEREISGLFPGEVEVNFDKIADSGYYAVYPSLYTPAGRLIMNYPPMVLCRTWSYRAKAQTGQEKTME